ncbi:MAG: cardiolipin synthase [Deltaproteobacteria bacterium]|nr:cardiolipin synthase [Deltaproteobacteria bacterium]
MFWLFLVELPWVIVISGYILLEKRPPMSTLAWILGLTFLPVIGLGVYLLFGPRRLTRKRLLVSRAREALQQLISAWDHLPASQLSALGQLSRMATRLGALPPESVAQLTLYTDGDSTFDALIAAIGEAKKHVHAEYYIFRSDKTGTRIRDALVERAKAGVTVRLLVDALGSSSTRAAFFDPLVAAGGKVAFFNPPFVKFGRRIFNFRTHRKILVVDGVIGFTGGVNVCDDHSARAMGPLAWRDTHLRVDGAAAHGLQRTFLENWQFSCEEQDKARLSPDTVSDLFPRAPGGDRAVQIISSGPDSDARAIASFYFTAISSAHQRVWLTTPYFVPEDSLINALCTAALRGVDVQLVLPTSTDARLVDAAGATYHEILINAGVRIHLYGPEMIHAKTCLVDQDLAIVGTANLDARSLRLNFEVIAAAYDRELNEELARAFEKDKQKTKERKTSDARLPLRTRLFQSAARLLAPQL